MNYLNWNNLIASHFFKPEMAGRTVHLYVTEELIGLLGQQKRTDLVHNTNAKIAFSESGRVFRVNDNRGQLFKGATGTASFSHGKKTLLDQWIDERFQNKPNGVRFKQKGDHEAIAIVAPKTTGVLRIKPAAAPDGLCLDPITSGSATKAAFYSAAFIVRAVAAQELDIDLEELDVSGLRFS